MSLSIVSEDLKRIGILSQPGLSGLIENHIGITRCQSCLALNSEGLFLSLLSEIEEHFLEDNDIYFDISNMSDVVFIKEMNKHMFSNFARISKEGSSDSYSEIYFFLFLLSNRFGKDFFSDGDIYSKANFTEIFGEYMGKIKSFEDLNNEESFSYIDSFSRLCGVLNLICLLSQNDNLRRDDISKLSGFMVEKIDELLSYLQKKGFDNTKIINSLLHIKGLQPLNFSYIEYVSLEEGEKGLKNFLLSYDKIITNTLEGFDLCRKSNYSDDEKRESIIKKATLTNLGHIISLIIIKTDGKVSEEDLYNNPIFKSILDKFISGIESIGISQTIDLSHKKLSDIKWICNLLFIDNYDTEDLKLNTGSESLDLIDDFLGGIIKGGKITSVKNLEKLHHIVLLNSDISDNVLIELLYFLYSDKSSSNINYEILRLKLFNIILTRLVYKLNSSDGNKESIKNFLFILTEYIDKNKISSFLLFAYSLMYASIGYCYSFFDDDESQKLAFKNYSKFRQINHDENFPFGRYGINIDRFYLNIGMYKAISFGIVGGENCIAKGCESFKSSQCFYKINECKNKDTIKRIGIGTLKEQSEMYGKEKSKATIYLLESYFLTINEKEELDLEGLSQHLSENLASIFHGVTDIKVVDIHGYNYNPKIPRYHSFKEIELVNGYRLQFIYPNIFSEYFEDFYRDFSGIPQDREIDFKNHKGGMENIVTKLKTFLNNFNNKNAEALSLVKDFENAIKKGNLKPNFQEIVDKDLKTVKFELLTGIFGSKKKKIIDENGVEKEVFYNIREYLDAMNKLKRHDLTKILMKMIIDEVRELLKNDKNLNLSINVEYSDIIDEDIILMLEELANIGIDNGRVTIELIEGKWDNGEEAIKNIKRLKEKGYKIAIDDFGAGDSNFNRLIELLKLGLLDYIKIDGPAVIKNLLSNDEKLKKSAFTIIGAIVDLAITWSTSDHKVKTVAEYVENEDIFEILSTLGIDLFQGYGVGKPISKEELLKKLEENKNNSGQ